MAIQLYNEAFSNQYLALDPTISGNGLRAASSDDSPVRFLISDDGAGFLRFAVVNSELCLDVYGDDAIRPRLATCGDASGQQWWRTGDKLSNSFSGEGYYLDVYSDTRQAFMSQEDFSGQYWQEVQVEVQAVDSSSQDTVRNVVSDPVTASTTSSKDGSAASNTQVTSKTAGAQAGATTTDSGTVPTAANSQGAQTASITSSTPTGTSLSGAGSSTATPSPGLSPGAKAGIGIGIALAAIIAGLLTFLLFARRKRARTPVEMEIKHHPYGLPDPSENKALSQAAFEIAGAGSEPMHGSEERRRQSAFVQTQFGEKVPLYSTTSKMPPGGLGVIGQASSTGSQEGHGHGRYGQQRAQEMPTAGANQRFLLDNGRWI